MRPLDARTEQGSPVQADRRAALAVAMPLVSTFGAEAIEDSVRSKHPFVLPKDRVVVLNVQDSESRWRRLGTVRLAGDLRVGYWGSGESDRRSIAELHLPKDTSHFVEFAPFSEEKGRIVEEWKGKPSAETTKYRDALYAEEARLATELLNGEGDMRALLEVNHIRPEDVQRLRFIAAVDRMVDTVSKR